MDVVRRNGTGTVVSLLTMFTCLSVTAAAENVPDRVLQIESLTTVPIRHSTISAREAGMIESVSVRPGDTADEHQVLVELDADRQKLAVTAATLNLRIAELHCHNELPLDLARSTVREAEQKKMRLETVAEITRLQAESDVAIRLAEKVQEAALFELERAQKARDSFTGSVSPIELNRLRVIFEQRLLEAERAREERTMMQLKPREDQAAMEEHAELLARSRVQLAQEERQLQIAQAQRDVLLNDLQLARLMLDRRRLKAPFSGTVVAVDKQPGEWVEPGEVVVRLIQLSRLRVEGFVDATLAPALQAGMPVRIRFPGYPNLNEVEGAVAFVSPEVDPVSQQVRLWAEFENPDLNIQPGLPATMHVSLKALAAIPGTKHKVSAR